MRALDGGPHAFVVPSEYDRLAPGATLRPTLWQIRSLSGAEVYRWSEIKRITLERAAADSPEEIAEAALRVETDMLAAALVRIDDYENPAGDPPYLTIDEATQKRAAINSIEIGDRNALIRAIKERSVLALGEPARLRSLLMSYIGARQSPTASASSTVGSAPAPANTGDAAVSGIIEPSS